MKIAGIILFACGLVLLHSCDSGDVEQVFNSEKRALQNKLNRERVLRVGLQAYIDSILNKDTMTVMHRMEHYTGTLFETDITPTPIPKNTIPEKIIEPSVALQNLENILASWVQKLPPQDWKLAELGAERLTLKISDQALFDEKGLGLHQSGKNKLLELSEQLQKHTNNQIYLHIEGHVDSLPKRSVSHWQYGWERAQKVGEALIDAGFPVSHLSIGSHGATAPAATNATEAGRYLNRRTFLILYVK